MTQNFASSHRPSNGGSGNSREAKGLGMTPSQFGVETGHGLWTWQPHLELMSDALLDILAGKILRLLMMEPPQTGKTEFWSRIAPVYALGLRPNWRIIVGSYNASHASEQGEAARNKMQEFGPEYFGLDIDPARSARDNWGLIDTRTNKPTRGGMRTMGMDSGITGKPCEWFNIDDPFKGWEEASSPAHRERVWKVFTSSVNTRMRPGGAISAVFTPWNENDLGGMLMRAQPKKWHILRIPGLAEEPVPAEVRAKKEGYSALVGAPDPLGRDPGEPLWYDKAHYAEKKAIDPDTYDALYACNPHPPEGTFFQRSWFKDKVKDRAPRCTSYVRYWDKAASTKGNWSAGVLMGVLDGDVFIIDVERKRLEPGPRDAWIRGVAVADKAMYGEVTIWGEHAGNEHKETAANFVKNLIGFVANTEGTGNKSKSTRAYPFAKYCQAGNVYLVRGDWNEAFLDELSDFKPEVDNQQDDQVDAASGAFGKLSFTDDPGGYASISDAEFAELEGANS